MIANTLWKIFIRSVFAGVGTLVGALLFPEHLSTYQFTMLFMLVYIFFYIRDCAIELNDRLKELGAILPDDDEDETLDSAGPDDVLLPWVPPWR